MTVVYLDKKDRVHSWFTPRRKWAFAMAFLVLLFMPIRRVAVSGQFILEPATRAIVRAGVSGAVIAVSSEEGDQVKPGQPLMKLENLQLESQAGMIHVQSQIAQAKAIQASMNYKDLGEARASEQGLLQQDRVLKQKLSMLDVCSPIAGTVLTSHMKDKLGSYLREGDLVAEIGYTSHLKARIYIPEYELRYVASGSEVHMRAGAEFLGVKGEVVSISPAAEEAVAGLESLGPYKGLRPPPFYAVEASVPNPSGELSPGMTGDARIFSSRRSLFYFIEREIRDFFGGKLW